MDESPNDNLRAHIVADLLMAKTDIDVMRTLCCGYYAYYCGFDAEVRAELDKCAEGVRTKALERMDDLEQEIKDGYIIKED